MRRPNPMIGLLVAVLAVSLFQVAYVAVGRQPPPDASWLASFALGLGFILWIDADARRRRGQPCHDFGFLVAVYFPFSLFWYALWSRGWRGWLTLLALLGLMLVPWISAVVAWLIVAARA